ncbi:THIF-type NAD/FAD binding fold [Cinara cedri]|uniref:THIF-type NAD/FAD binding fold n=1 Tax=Cinara cedri TaxID=506608 RepID=A0A5E4NJ44_9HEMI|nr:THIF-type NAD/FAD binding fold [Cinara cedri]
MDSEISNNGADVGKLSKDELKVYDRQIRLWGHDGQKKLSSWNVLLIGLQGLGAEIAKNLILCGVHSITLKDPSDVSILDRCSQFLIPPDSEQRNRAKASLTNAQKLNPNVKVTADTKPIDEEDEHFVTKFDIVIATECFPATYKKLNENCRKNQVKLFIADVFGLFGYFVQDITFEHNLYHEIFPNYDQRSNVSENCPLPYYLTSALLRFQCESNRKPNPDTCEEDVEELKSIISSFEQITDIEAYDEYFGELFCEMSPTTSIIGAMVAQAAMNTIMDKTVEDFNVFFYDHVEHRGQYFKL